MMTTLSLAMAEVAVKLPDVSPEAPPGSKGFLTVLNWLAWAVIIAAIAGFLISLILMGIGAFRDGEVRHAKGLFVSIVVCILGGAVGAIFAIFT